MGFKDDKGEIVGFDIDLAREVAKHLGIEAEFKPSEWSGIVLELKSGNIDVVWNGMTITEERKKEIIFSNPYMNNSQIIVTLSNSPLNTKADLNGKVVGLQLGSSSFDAVSADELSKSLKELKKYDTNVEALMDLEAGRVEAVVIDEIVARYYIEQKEKETNKDIFKVIDGDFGTEEYGVGIRKEDTNLKEAIDKAIDEMKKDGSYDKIYEKWFGKRG
jgi:polar amino acid transport system substrate-binding protein